MCKYNRIRAIAVSNSISGYNIEIFLWQLRHSPLSNNQESTGILSYQEIGCLQLMQHDFGLMIEMPFMRR